MDKERKKTQITKIRNESRDITTNCIEIKKKILRILWIIVHQQIG